MTNPALIPITAEIVERDDRSVTIRIDAGRYARLSLAHVEITPADDGRHVVEMPAWVAGELGI